MRQKAYNTSEGSERVVLRQKRVWVGFLVTLVFLALFVRQVEFSRIGETLAAAQFVWLIPAVPCYFLGVWFRAARWRHLLLPLRSFSTGLLFPYVVIGYMANDLLPMRVGELVRAYVFGTKRDMPKSPVLGTIALERLTDGITLLAFAALIGVFVPFEGWVGQTLRLTGAAFVGGLAALLLVVRFELASLALLLRVTRVLPVKARATLLAVAEGLLAGMASLRSPRQILGVSVFSLLAWGSEAGVFYFVGLALGLDMPLYVYFLAMSLGNLVTALPSSQAGIGPFEYFTAQALVLFSVDASLAGIYALLVHAVLIVPVVLLGLVYLWIEQFSLGEIVARATSEPIIPKAQAAE